MMFDDLIRQVGRLERGMTVSVCLPSDHNSYLDRRCPSKNCGAIFKVFEADWDKKVAKDRAYCPLCRQESHSENWVTPAQKEYAKAVAMREFRKRLHGV